MSDAMNIKLTVADFEEMDANTLLGLHNKILGSRDDVSKEGRTSPQRQAVPR